MSVQKIFYLPDLGEGLPDAEVREWYVKEGDTVALDQPMVAMETAKAVVDVPAPRAGTVAKLHGAVGDVIKTGAPLIEFTDGAVSTASAGKKDAGTVVGSIEVGDTVIEESAMGVQPVLASGVNKGLSATPAVRALAKSLGVELAGLVGTGPNGSITAEDVKKATTTQGATTTAPAQGYVPLKGVRRMMVASMVQSHTEVVPVSLSDVADIQAWSQGTDITARVIRALIQACRQEPHLNAWFDKNSVAHRVFSEVHLGLAVDTEEGLFVPVIRGAESKSPSDLRSEINRLKEAVKARRLAPEALQGATITLSNFGVFAGRYANPVIVPPQVAILGTGKIHEVVVCEASGKMAAHRTMPLSLTFDHRAATGGEAARFLAAVIADLEKAD